MQEFPCNQCGLCCRMVGLVIGQLKEKGFPYEPGPDGACEKLVDNQCSIYEDRPDVCRIDRMAETSDKTKFEYYTESINVCNQLKKINGRNDFI